jgi:hypothetical protein
MRNADRLCPGAYNSHSLAVTSKYTTNCATGSRSVEDPDAPPPVASDQPKAMGGICSLHLNETRTCGKVGNNDFGTIVVRDNVNSVIFQNQTRTTMSAVAH